MIHKICLCLLTFALPVFASIIEQKISFNQLNGWNSADIRPTIAHLKQIESHRPLPSSWNEFMLSLNQVPITNNLALKTVIESYFSPYVITDSNSPPLVTGYHIYITSANYKKSPKFSSPIYKHPKHSNLAYHISHANILNGALANQNLELAWLPSHLDVYLLMLQGSGILTFADGHKQLVSYAGSNGYPYQSISDYMINEGYITPEQRTGPFIKSFLTQRPQLQHTILSQNPSYVFFKFSPMTSIVGAHNSPLKEHISIAVDRSFYQLPDLFWLESEVPLSDTATTPFQQLVIAQDTGGAIKGPQRLDLFFGSNKIAETFAGLMHHDKSRLILFKLKSNNQ